MIAQDLKQIEKLISKLLKKSLVNVATKEDLKQFATKQGLKIL